MRKIFASFTLSLKSTTYCFRFKMESALVPLKADLLAKQNERQQVAGVQGYYLLSLLADNVARGPDFRLTLPKNYDGPIKFRYPESFKACFSEIRFALEDGQNEAFFTMDYISKSVPEIKKAMGKVDKLFEGNDPKKTDKLKQIYLRSPKELSEKANGKVEETVRKFDFLILFLQEIILRSRGTEGAQQEDIENLSSLAERLKLQQKFHEEQLQKNTEDLDQTKVKAALAERDLDESVQNMDSWWSIIKTGARIKLAGTPDAKLEQWQILEAKKKGIAEQVADLERQTVEAKMSKQEVIEMLSKTVTEKTTKEEMVKRIQAGLRVLEEMRAQWVEVNTFFKGFNSTFDLQLKNNMGDYLAIAGEGDQDFLEEMRDSAKDVSIGCDSILSFANCYKIIHLDYLTPMMLMFPLFITSRATDEDRDRLQTWNREAEQRIQMMALEDRSSMMKALTFVCQGP